MKVKKIEIFGFKSFADKVILDFHEGITCIVGPNGCGKSNIADSIRWVFGEQSAKSLRGSKMADIIFAGTANRKGLNFAEVSLTFDEVNGALPLDYEEVTVTRRLHRSGESEYFINRQPVRLKDIQQLFLDSGIGRTAFSIFEQGKIDQLIQATPEQRRGPFEEAAGVGRFLFRKKEVLSKFEHVKLNLERANDIYQEVEKQVAVLEEQAQEAKHFKDEKKKLDHLERQWLAARLSTYTKQESEIQAKKSVQLSAVEDFKKEVLALQEQLKKIKEAFEQEEAAAQRLNSHVFGKKSEKRAITERESACHLRLKDLDEQQKENQLHHLELQNKRTSWKGEIALYKSQLAPLDKELLQAKKAFAEEEALFQSLEQELLALKDKQVKGHRDKVQHLREESQKEQELKTDRIRIESHQEKLSHLLERQKRLEQLTEQLRGQESEKKRELESVFQQIDSTKEALNKLDENLFELTKHLQNKSKELDLIKKQQQEAAARLNALQRLKDENVGFSAGSKQILKEAETQSSPLFKKVKRLYEYFSVTQGYESALALALKTYSETLVVANEEDLQLLLSFAKEKKIKDFSILCLAYVKITSREPQKLETLLSKANPTELAAHFLNATYLVDTIQSALKLNKAEHSQSITSEPYFLDSFNVIHLSSLQEQSVFVREGEIKELEKKIKTFQKMIDQLKTLLDSDEEKKQTLSQERSLLDKTLRQQDMKGIEVNLNYQRVATDVRNSTAECKQVAIEIGIIQESIAHLTKRIQGLASELECLKHKTLSADQSQLIIERGLEEKSKTRELKILDLKKTKDHYSQISEKTRKLNYDLSLLGVKDQESESTLLRLEGMIQKNQAQQQLLIVEAETLKKECESLQFSLEKEEIHLSESSQAVKQAKGQIELQEGQLLGKQQEMKNAELKLNQLDIQSAQVSTTLKAIESEIQQRYDLEELKQMDPLAETLDKAEKEIKRLRHKLDSSQNINMAAIENFDEQQTRAQFLKSQITDLEVSKEELLKIITTLDDEGRSLFESTFQKIRTNFKKNFSILFNGGEADLQLIDSSDVLEAGIDIVAKPPGKQMRSLSLLSGGEKCLTAMALLFSIFEVKSAPFCILDEIDAPLDDSNVERFVNVVKQFTDQCQFIIITHNKRTMAIADRLFGVSMQEKGVSKLLSIEFSASNQKKLELVEV